MLKAMATPVGSTERSVIPTSQNPNKELGAYGMNFRGTSSCKESQNTNSLQQEPQHLSYLAKCKFLSDNAEWLDCSKYSISRFESGS